MRASQVLQRCLQPALAPMHALRRHSLLAAVESLLAGRRLVLIDLARSWVGAERIRAPLKRLDRLLSNPRLHAERERLYGGMVRWRVRSPTPVIVVDWCRLKGDGHWHLLRAAVPVGGRSLTLFEQVFPERELASPTVERRFLGGRFTTRQVIAGALDASPDDRRLQTRVGYLMRTLGWRNVQVRRGLARHRV